MLAIMVPLMVLLFSLILTIKNKVVQYRNLITPFLTSVCWCFCLIPIFVIIPIISIYISNESSEFANLAKTAISLIAVFLMIGVTIFAIFFNIFLNVILACRSHARTPAHHPRISPPWSFKFFNLGAGWALAIMGSRGFMQQTHLNSRKSKNTQKPMKVVALQIACQARCYWQNPTLSFIRNDCP